MTSLSGTSVLVAGATGGLGRQIVSHLAVRGARLTLVGRSQERLQALGVDGAATHAADLTTAGAARGAVQAALDAHGRLDGVVCAIGVVAFGNAEDLDDGVLTLLVATNLLAPVRLLQAAVPHLGEGGFVANLSAVVAESPTAGMAAYSATKAGLTAFDEAVARELRGRRIRVLDVRPPHTETGLVGRALAGSPPRLREGLSPADVAGRIVTAIEADERGLPASSFA